MSDQAAISPVRFSESHRSRGISRRLKRFGVWLVFAALAVSTLYPLFFLVSTALRPPQDYVSSPASLPNHLTLHNVSGAFDIAHIGTYALNSLLVVVPAVALITVFATMAAYALSQFAFPFKRVLAALILVTLAIPPTVLLIPIFKVIVGAGLLNNRLGLILVYTTLNLPFSIFLLASFMRLIPRELLLAAKVDGASSVRILTSVVVPLVRPALLTLTTLNFLFLWNEFLFSLVLLQDEAHRTIMVGIAVAQGQFKENVGIVAAGLMLSIVPPLLIFIFFQRSLTRGLTAGAVK